ncbi:hypothetical protein pb186bvf_018809 [Paramecium bursaria]
MIYLLIINIYAYQIILDKTRVVGEICIQHVPDQNIELTLKDLDFNQFNSSWLIVSIKKIMNTETADDCVVFQLQKRAYLDWMQRFGNKALNGNFVILITGYRNLDLKLDEPSLFYDLIDVYDPQQNTPRTYRNNFTIEKQFVQSNTDIFIKYFQNDKFQRTIQIRILDQPPQYELDIQLEYTRLVNYSQDMQNITLNSGSNYNWKVTLNQPTRFGPKQISTLISLDSSTFQLSLQPLWRDQLFIFVIILQNYQKQYYICDWIHVVGHQWNLQINSDCSLSDLLNQPNNIVTYCLEWLSQEQQATVYMPNYSFSNYRNPICRKGFILYKNQPTPFCICPFGNSGVYCDEQINQTLSNQFVNQTIISLLNPDYNDTKNLTRIIKIAYLLTKQFSGLEYLIINQTKNITILEQMQYQYLLLDILCSRAIVDQNATLALELQNLFSYYFTKLILQGTLDFNQFVLRVYIQNSLYQNAQKNSSNFDVQLSEENVSTICTFNNQSFYYGLLFKFTKNFSLLLEYDLQSTAFACMGLDYQFKPLKIDIDLVMPIFKSVSQIKKPGQLICNNTQGSLIYTIQDKCRLININKFISFMRIQDSGIFFIHRSRQNKTFNPNQIITIVKQQAYGTLIFYFVYLVFI